MKLFYLRTMTRVGEPDSLTLIGTPAAAKLEDNRAILRLADAEPGQFEKYKPYVLPEADAFAGLAQRPSTTGEPPCPST